MLGLIMVFSASYISSQEYYGTGLFLLGKQTFFMLLGLFLAWVVGQTRAGFWYKFGEHFHLGICILLGMTVLDLFAHSAKGASRWLSIANGPQLQPGELLKYSVLFAAVPFFDQFANLSLRRRLYLGGLLGAPLLLLALQPDFGTLTIIFLTLVLVAFFSDLSRRYLYSGIFLGLLSLISVLLAQPYRVKRLVSFLDPWKNPRGSGFQVIQSFLAFANGSWSGKGLGNSNEKLFYLPEAHNDFIFSVLGEELGLLGVSATILLYLALIYFGLRMAFYMQKRFNRQVVVGITFLLGLQAQLNMAVVLGILPTKGLNLPLISAGGSSLVANFFALGIIFSLLKDEKREYIQML